MSEEKAEEKAKVPGQFFQWFESLKQGYDNSINRLFNRVEAVNEDHKAQMKEMYQSQIDGLKKSYQDHLHALKDSHRAQMAQAQSRIGQLEKDSEFYQDQIKTQHRTIDRLNDRYDAVLFALTDKMDSKELENVIKDISPTEFDGNKPSLQHQQDDRLENSSDNISESTEQNAESLSGPLAPPERKTSNPLLEKEQSQETASEDTTADNTEQAQPALSPAQVLQQAFDARNAQQFEQAYELFVSAAKGGEAKAMGAIGRAHFIGEGTTLDKATGLAWLIVAAEHDFEPAKKKVAGARQKTPELYDNALALSTGLLD